MSERLKIVVLDGYALNPGDLSWDGLQALGDCEIHDRTPAGAIVERAQGARAVFTNKTPLSAETIAQLPALEFIGVLATGYNQVDGAAARERGIPVCNVPAYGTQSVAQMVFAHILNATQRVAQHAVGVREGRWARGDDFCYWDFPLIELAGLTLGIVGYGRIGQAAADLGRAFGMKILATGSGRRREAMPGVRFVELDELLAQSDFVSLHCPLTKENRHMINRESLARMKPAAWLINTGRGPLIDEAALAEALRTGAIAGAGLDVLEQEPPAADNPLYGLDNCYITPHIAWATHAARSRLLDTAVENLRAFLDGRPQNQVNA